MSGPFAVRFHALADFAVADDQAPGVLAALQRLDLADPGNVAAHVRDHGPGLLRAVTGFSDIPALHRLRIDRVTGALCAAVAGGPLADVAVMLTLHAGPVGPVAVLEPADTASPYRRARLEGLLALSADGPGLGVCACCGRPFIQVRSGPRYSRFCPGYDCSETYRRTHYETTDYRRDYRRRALALARLKAKPGTSPAVVGEAEREFQAWRAAARGGRPRQ